MSRKKPTGKQKGSVQKKVAWKALEIVHPNAAGIDVGGSEHWVAVNPECDPEPVRRFGCFTADLREMGQWLVQKGVRSVAMQSTGVYWMPVLDYASHCTSLQIEWSGRRMPFCGPAGPGSSYRHAF